MLEVNVPGRGLLRLEHLVLDFNGTLARDGTLIAGVEVLVAEVAGVVEVHVVTGDTFATAARAMAGLPCKLVTLDQERQAEAKLAYLNELGCKRSACIGNGHNDRLVLAAAALGIAVVQGEGAAQTALSAAEVICLTVIDALELLVHPLRIAATLRA